MTITWGRGRKELAPDHPLRGDRCARSLTNELSFALAYLCFFSIVLAFYWALPRRGQNALLVLVSYVFYGWEHPWFLLPLWGSTIVDYSCARAMEKTTRYRRAYLVLSILVSVALLGTFKYAGFAIGNLNEILTHFGDQPLAVIWQLALPAGLFAPTPFNPSATSSMSTSDASKPSETCSITRSTSPSSPSLWPGPLSGPAICCRNITAIAASIRLIVARRAGADASLGLFQENRRGR